MLDQLVPNLGVHSRVSTRKAQELLGWHPRPARVTLVDTARSLIDKHLVQLCPRAWMYWLSLIRRCPPMRDTFHNFGRNRRR
jgi:hypothetical protein